MPKIREKKQKDQNDAPAPIISLVGLNETARALGLALQRVKTRYQILGHDREASRVRKAQTVGAIDKGTWNLIRCVEDADLIVLSEPVDQLCATLETIVPHLKPGVLVTDTAPLKAPVMQVARQCMPEGCSFIGGHPILKNLVELNDLSATEIMDDEGEGEDDLARSFDKNALGNQPFENATYCLTPLSSASEEAIRVLRNLIAAIGAKVLYIDAEEHDALVTGSNLLPRLADLAILQAMAGSASARDLQKLSSAEFLASIDMSESQLAALRTIAERDRAGLQIWITQLERELSEIKAALESEETLKLLFERFDTTRQNWIYPPADRDEISEAYDDIKEQASMRSLFLGRLGKGELPKKMRDHDA